MSSSSVRALFVAWLSISLSACGDPPCEGDACCGNGEIDDGEECDDGDANSSAWSTTPHCNAVCSGMGPYCGDGELAPQEVCDEGAENADGWAATARCNTRCDGFAPYCGDENIDAPNEACDDGDDNNDEWNGFAHCNASCTGDACGLPEPTPITPRPGVPYPAANPHGHNKMLLGKILFWEEQMSSDDTVACGTCHRPAAGGTDPRSATARHPGGTTDPADDPHGSPGIKRCQVGVGGTITYVSDPTFDTATQVTSRRAPSNLDAMFTSTLFLDGRATSNFIDPDTSTELIPTGDHGALESQAVGPPVSDVEMACEERTWADIHVKLQAAVPLALASDLPPDVANFICKYPTYPELFAAVYGDAAITTARIAFAIATYERTLVSDQSPFHTSTLTAQQIAGRDLAIGGNGKCQRCHIQTMQFSGDIFANLGFEDPPSTFDTGAGNNTFRTTTLMNVGLREAAGVGLLHDGLGAGASLEAVMAAYNDPPVPPDSPPGTNPGSTTSAQQTDLLLSQTDITAIVDFLRNGLTDPRVALEQYPFDRPTLSTE